MISEVVMPQMGADMEEGTILRWLKQDGEAVDRGEIIAEIETDKANVEIEAFESGVFRKTLASEGDTVSVGTVIALIGAEDDDISSYKPAATSEPASLSDEASVGPERQNRPASTASTAPPSEHHAAKLGRVRASPVARKMAQARGIELSTITGTGPDGRIVRRDIEAADRGEGPRAPSKNAPTVAKATPAAPMSRMRQAIARRMAQSKREAPHYYITLDIDMTAAEAARFQLREVFGDEYRISVNDMLVKASAMALARHREFNSLFVDEQVQRRDAINICIGIALDDGLIAPAILDCENKSLQDIAQASRSLAERARSGKLKPNEISEGTFTVSNLGMFGVKSLVAIIQPPQTAILGVGAAREEPVVRDGQIELTRVMTLALSADHRVTDGAQGAQFLTEIQRWLQNPAGLLV